MVMVGENSLLNKIVSNRHVLRCMYMQGTALNHSDNVFFLKFLLCRHILYYLYLTVLFCDVQGSLFY